MRAKVTIRKVRAKDVPSIVELWKELMDFHKAVDPVFTRCRGGHKAFAEYLSSEYIGADQRAAWVALAGRKVVGFCMAVIEDNPPVLVLKQHGQIEALAVTRRWRAKGVGARMVKRARKWFSEKGVRRIEARVAKANKVSTAFWAKIGFSPYLETVFLEV